MTHLVPDLPDADDPQGVTPFDGSSRPPIMTALTGLVESAEAIVVLSSLARLCVPAFSDTCEVRLSEGLDPLFQVEFPGVEPVSTARATTAGGSKPTSALGGKITTGFHSPATWGQPAFAGVMTHAWATRSPDEAEATIAQLVIDRAMALVQQQRAAESGRETEVRVEKLAFEVITDRILGQAQGILMSTQSVSEAESLMMLRQTSHRTRHSLYHVALDVVKTHEPHAPSSQRAEPGPGPRTLHTVPGDTDDDPVGRSRCAAPR